MREFGTEAHIIFITFSQLKLQVLLHCYFAWKLEGLGLGVS
jgi:hypothetical protein